MGLLHESPPLHPLHLLATRQGPFMVARGVFGNRRTGGVQNAVSVAGMEAATKIESPGVQPGQSGNKLEGWS